MTVFFTWLLRTIGIGGMAFLSLWIYDWGIPGAARIPYLSSIPIIGDLTTGRAQTYANEQVRIATAKMVSAFEYEVVAQQLAEERRRANQAAQITEEYRKRTEAAVRATAQAQDKLEKAIADDKDTDSPPWSDGDFGWLCRNGSKAPECSR